MTKYKQEIAKREKEIKKRKEKNLSWPNQSFGLYSVVFVAVEAL